MNKEDLIRIADEMRAAPPSFFQFEGLHDLDSATSLKEFWISRGDLPSIHFYLIAPARPSQPFLPFVVNFHGGGMVREHSDRDLLFCRRIALNGCAVISVDYHLAPQFPYPYALDESQLLLRHVNEYAKQYGLISGKYILCGQSSGGNLAFVTSLRLKHPDIAPLEQILCYGLFDQYTNPDQKPDSCPQERRDLYKFYFECYRSQEDARNPEVSPLFASKEELENLPYTLIIEGGLDELRDENMSLFRKLCAAQVKAEMAYYPQSPHGFIVNQQGLWKEAQSQLFQAVTKLLGLNL